MQLFNGGISFAGSIISKVSDAMNLFNGGINFAVIVISLVLQVGIVSNRIHLFTVIG